MKTKESGRDGMQNARTAGQVDEYTDCKCHWLKILQNSTGFIFKCIYSNDPVTSFEVVKGIFKMPTRRWNVCLRLKDADRRFISTMYSASIAM